MNIKNKKIIIPSILLMCTIFAGVFLVNVKGAQAQGGILDKIGVFVKIGMGLGESIMGTMIGNMARDLIIGTLLIVWSWAAAFLGFCGTLFTSVLDVTVIQLAKDSPYEGWKIVRDIVNMFFILGLVIISFATILRIETYGIKQLLPKLIIVAILINFSFLACGIIIDASNIPAKYFAGQLKALGEEGQGAGLILSSAMIDNPVQTEPPEIPENGESGNGENGNGENGKSEGIALQSLAHFAITMLFQTGVLMLASFVILIGAILLVVRMAALWLLVILAPFAWFFGIFPALKAQTSKWWSNFFKYAFFAPIYIFFVWLSIRIMGVLEIGPINTESASNMFASQAFQGAIQAFTHFVIIVILLLGAPIVAMSTGIYGSNAVIKGAQGMAKKGTSLPWRGVRSGAKALGQKFDRSVLAPAGLSATTMKRAWKERKTRKEEEAYQPATALMKDRLNKFMSLGKEQTLHAQRQKDLELDKERGTLKKQGLSPEELTSRAYTALSSGNTTEFQAAALEATSSGGVKSLFEHKELGSKYNNEVTPENLKGLIEDSIKNERERINFANKIESAAKAKGDYQFTKLTKYDQSQGKTVWTAPDEAKQLVTKSIMSMPTDKRWQELDKSTFLTEDSRGNLQVTDVLKQILRQISNRDVEKAPEEMSSINIRYIKNGKNKIQNEINGISDPSQKIIAQNWLNGLMQELKPQKKKTGGTKGTKVPGPSPGPSV